MGDTLGFRGWVIGRGAATRRQNRKEFLGSQWGSFLELPGDVILFVYSKAWANLFEVHRGFQAIRRGET